MDGKPYSAWELRPPAAHYTLKSQLTLQAAILPDQDNPFYFIVRTTDPFEHPKPSQAN